MVSDVVNRLVDRQLSCTGRIVNVQGETPSIRSPAATLAPSGVG